MQRGVLSRLWEVTACVILALLFVVWPCSAYAVTWDVNYSNWSQVRKGRFPLDVQVPVDQYMGFGFSELPLNIGVQTNFKAFTDSTQPSQQFDLYEGVIHMEPVSHFTMDGGRQWEVDGFDAGLLDGLKLQLFPESSHIGGSLFGGIPHYNEDGNLRGQTEGIEAGLNLNLLNVDDTALQFSMGWKKIDATMTSWKRNDTIYTGIVGSHQFKDVWASPNIYGDAEFDVAGKVFNVATLGVDLYPHWRIALTLEGNRFDVNRSSIQQSVFGNFFSGAIAQGREAMQVKIAKSLHFFEDFSYQHYSVPGRGGESGYTADAGFEYYWEKAKFSTLAQYYFLKSFGGTVNGSYIHVANNYLKKWLFEFGVDVSHYTKLSGQRSTPVSVTGDVAYLINDRCRFSLGGELNHNIWFSRDGRITLNLQLAFDKADYHPELRSKKVNRKFHEI